MGNKDTQQVEMCCIEDGCGEGDDMTCENTCTTQETMKIRAIRRRLVAYAGQKVLDEMIIDGIEQLHVCIHCGKQEWIPVEEVEE